MMNWRSEPGRLMLSVVLQVVCGALATIPGLLSLHLRRIFIQTYYNPPRWGDGAAGLGTFLLDHLLAFIVESIGGATIAGQP